MGQEGKKRNAVCIQTGAWLADRTICLEMPAGWHVSVFPLRRMKVLGDRDIETAFACPVGQSRISERARGKQRIAVIVDDISRPTPAHRLIPPLLRELKSAGISNHQIRFIVAVGNHRPLSRQEMIWKLGEPVVSRYPVRNHNFAASDLVCLGTGKWGVPLWLDAWVAEADMKIGIGSIIPHDAAGFSGGGKCVIPGVSGFPTLLALHGLFEKRGRGEQQGDSDDFRSCIDSLAGMAGLDTVINTVVDEKRNPVGLVTGDMIGAFEAGAAMARSCYTFTVRRDMAEKTDIVLLNAYPLDMDPDQLLKAVAPAIVFPHARVVLYNEATDGTMFRGLNVKSRSLTGGKGCRVGRSFLPQPAGNRKRMLRRIIRKSRILPLALKVPGLFEKMRRQQRNYEAHQMYCEAVRPDERYRENSDAVHNDSLIVVSPHLSPVDFYRRFPDGRLFKNWQQARHTLESMVPDARIAVLPSAPLQIPEVIE